MFAIPPIHRTVCQSPSGATRLAKGTSSGRLEMELALVDDALGRPQQARRHYDRLGRSVWSDLVALPSAANLAALGRYRDADRAFAQIASKGANADEKAYAQLWRLWLVTRDNASSRRARDTAFKRLLAAVRPEHLHRERSQPLLG